jgi:ADP-heptose:LPS heptosyltransferase
MKKLIEVDNPTYKVVALFCHGIGDGILSLPMLRALMDIFGERLTLVVPNDQTFWFLHQLDTNIVTFNAEPTMQGLAEAFEKIGDCDIFISTMPWFNETLKETIKILSPQHTIGFFQEFDTAVTYQKGIHEIEALFNIIKAIQPSLSFEPYSYAPPISDLAQSLANNFTMRHKLDNKKIIAIHTDTNPKKMWNENNWLDVITQFLTKYPDYCCLAVGNKFPLTAYLNEQFIFDKQLSFEAMSALVAKSDIFLGIDSCFLHVADFFRVPSVGIFGPSNPAKFGLYLTNYLHLYDPLDINKISPEQVLHALQKVIAI